MLEDKLAVGGGAFEAELYVILNDLILMKEYNDDYETMNAWIDSLLAVPSTISQNAGFSDSAIYQVFSPLPSITQFLSKFGQNIR